MAECAACRAPIRWAVVDGFKARVALDRQPLSTGSIQFGYNGRGRTLDGDELERARGFALPLYQHHRCTRETLQAAPMVRQVDRRRDASRARPRRPSGGNRGVREAI